MPQIQEYNMGVNIIDLEYYRTNEFVLNQFSKQKLPEMRERNINAKPKPTPEKSIKENNYISLDNFPQLNMLAKSSSAISDTLETIIAKNGISQIWKSAHELDYRNSDPSIKTEAISFLHAMGTTFERLTNAWISSLLPNGKGIVDAGSCFRVFAEIDGCHTPDGLVIDKAQVPTVHTLLECKTNYNKQYEANVTQLNSLHAFTHKFRGEEIPLKNPTILDKYGPDEKIHTIKFAPDAKVTLVLPYKYPKALLKKLKTLYLIHINLKMI
jgi:hypothetical protein